jgi:UDP-glucuronate decarboxylase
MLEVDQIYHLACPASPVHYQYNPVKTIKTNVMGTLNMLGLAKRVKARILLASTSEIYGDPQVHPQREDYWGNVNCLGPRSCYDEGKRVAETLMMDYHRQNRVDIRIARIFNTYGPRMAINDGRVISNFCVQALTGQDITIYGEGSQTRSFCYVTDLVEGLARLMNSEAFHGPVNLGNPEEYTILELAQKILAMTKSPAKLVYKPLPPDDPVKRKPDIGRARELLQWQPTVALTTGLEETIPYFRTKLIQNNFQVVAGGAG